MAADPEPLDPLTVLVTATWPVAELAGLPVWLGALAIATGRDIAAATALTVAIAADALALWPARTRA
jgi:hypothetical protein